MFNKFYFGITKLGMFLEAPLREPGQHLAVPFNGATTSRAGLISCRLWSSPGWPERQDSYLSYASGGPAPGRHSWCGSPHTQASCPNASGHGLAPSWRYR